MRSILPLFAFAFTVSTPATADAQTVTVPNFRSVELRGGGDVAIVPGPVQRVTILAGSTQFTSLHTERDGQLRIDACNDRCPHNYRLRIRIESPRMPSVAVEAGGTIVAQRGFAPQSEVAAAVSAGGTIDLRAVDAERVVAAVHAGGDIYATPRARLTAAVSGGGDIHYWGNPAVTMAVNGGGDVRREN